MFKRRFISDITHIRVINFKNSIGQTLNLRNPSEGKECFGFWLEEYIKHLKGE